MVRLMPARLPSLHRNLPEVRLGPTEVPLASAPWHPAQVPPAAWPSKMRRPSATCCRVAPEGTGRAEAARPAFGWMPSGGSALPDETAPPLDDGAEASAAVAPPCQ